MKIAVPCRGTGSQAPADSRFGRAEGFYLFDPATGCGENVENAARTEAGGAGGHAVRCLAGLGITVILAPDIGPNALEAIQAFGVRAFRLEGPGTVEEAIARYDAGALPEIETPTAGHKSGLRKV